MVVDTATHWLELARIPTDDSCSCANRFDLCWLCQCPQPDTVKHDNGNKFIGEEFQELLALWTSLYKGFDWKEDIDALIQAIGTTTPSNASHSPSHLVLGMDMIFHQKVKINWALFKKQQHVQTLANNTKENRIQ
ncbi:hypothetical protein ACHAW6_008538 [Cyclotella cf. meneghiniana]